MSDQNDDRATPAILKDDKTVDLLERIPFDSPPFDEKRLQEFLAQHPETLPIRQLDSGFAPAICIGRETPTGAGQLDNLYISPNGLITLVETKLWKNPQARREVVAQIIDYTKQIATWDYRELEERVAPYLETKHGWTGTLYGWLEKNRHWKSTEQQQFVDRVNDTLEHGRFLLLIVGDGIRTGVREMVSYLQDTPQLQFRLALVEMGCYRPKGQEWPVLIVPQIVTKTAEIERAVVRVELCEDAKKLLNTDTFVPTGQPTVGPSEESFFSQLEESVGATASESLRRYVQRLAANHDSVEKTVTKQAQQLVVKCCFSSDGREYGIWLFSVTQKGDVKIGGKKKKTAASKSLKKELAESFWEDIGQACPSMQPTADDDGASSIPVVPLGDLLERVDEVEHAIARFVAAVDDATSDG